MFSTVHRYYMRFRVVMTTGMKMTSWMLCSVVCLKLNGVSVVFTAYIIMMTVQKYLWTRVTFCQTARCSIPEDIYLVDIDVGLQGWDHGCTCKYVQTFQWNILPLSWGLILLLKMEAISASETLLPTFRSVWTALQPRRPTSIWLLFIYVKLL
jgi:hypothetical protein